MSKTKVPIRETKLTFLGDGQVGKSSTLRTICNLPFFASLTSTLALEDTHVFQVDPRNLEWKYVTKYELSQQRIKNSMPTTINPSAQQEEKVSNSPDYKYKFEEELVERTVSDNKFINEMITGYYEYAEPDYYFRISDFGGQEVFYSLYHLFLSERGVYILVFNLNKAKEEDLYKIRFWLNTIEKYSPKAPFFIVGTFLDRFLKYNKENELENLSKCISDYLKYNSLSENLMKNENLCFFPLENFRGPNSEEAKKLKKKFATLISSTANVNKDLFSEAIRTPYVFFMDSCREQRNFFTLSNFKLLAQQSMFSDDEIHEMLNQFRTLGIVLYFPDLKVIDEQNYIFFSQSYLAQALGSFIRDESLHELAFRVKTELFTHYKKYVRTGKIHEDLLNNLLKTYSNSEKKFVINLAIQSLILIQVEINCGKYIYVIPSQLPNFVFDGKRKVIKPMKTPDVKVKFSVAINHRFFILFIIELFHQIEDEKSEIALFTKIFARIVVNTRFQFDIYLSNDKEVTLSFTSKKDIFGIVQKLQAIVKELKKSYFEDSIIVIDEIYMKNQVLGAKLPTVKKLLKRYVKSPRVNFSANDLSKFTLNLTLI
eukprot:snap_masked-scaffold_10-processed-gene-7.5-mRNA-1 protein AED:1.00 eAED:1.00 QI:0/0/0/0/1/1/3/0/597